MDSHTSKLGTDFKQVLDCLNLQQLVDGPTHKKGHTLDLVITDSIPLTDLHIYDIGTSDHQAVNIKIPQSSQFSKPKRHITFRNIKNIDPASFTQHLQLLSSPPSSSVSDLIDYYNNSLSHILDTHAPLKSRTVTFTRPAPWYTTKLRDMKRSGRVLERACKTSDLTVHKLAYREHQRSYAKALTTARLEHYSTIINNNPGNSKKLFSTIKHLLQPQISSYYTPSVTNCNQFLDFFTTKIDQIRSSLSFPNTSIYDIPKTPVGQLSEFSLTTQQEVEKIIRISKPSTCSLDPIPSPLLKNFNSSISPLITKIINLSLKSGNVPTSLKTALIKPLLKKPTLDPEPLPNYRPISNLPFISKLLEKVISSQLHNHLKANSLYEKFQSGFRPSHSTETALIRVTSDLLMASDSGSTSLLILLDLSAAFDTIDHSILLHRLQHHIGLSGTALHWFHSYLTDRTEYVALGDTKSRPHKVTCGVPQGSVLGPTLFTIYMLPLGCVVSRHGINFHCYADDTQLYLKISPSGPPSVTVTRLSSCLEEIEAWMSQNFLQLNGSKTEAIQTGTPQQLRSSPITSISLFVKVNPGAA
ncbi:hypothetical protein WMY93_012883 [Mugilogobius chulae]|uniref:Reverse transcriptase domain-containing protein n=1 Tax=Mugilogobius chulae TaxID=88201 RepID=A0AAW0P2H9_9GOBI